MASDSPALLLHLSHLFADIFFNSLSKHILGGQHVLVTINGSILFGDGVRVGDTTTTPEIVVNVTWTKRGGCQEI